MSTVTTEPTGTLLESHDVLAAPDRPTVPQSAPEAPAAFGAMTQRRVLGLALPIIGELLLQTFVGIADTFLVARLGSFALAGVGIAIEIVFLMIAALSAVATGATILVSHAVGAGEPETASRLARQAVVWGVALAIPVSVAGFVFSPAIVAAFGAEPDVAGAATTYLQITAATSVGLLLSFVCGAVLRGAGDSRTPLYAAVVANVLNVGLTYVLIFGHLGLPALGVAGSAVGAATGRIAGAAILLTLMILGRRAISLRGRDGWRPSLPVGRDLLRLGFPSALEEMLLAGGFTVMVGVVAGIGTAALAAQQIGFNALSLAFLPGFGFGIASTALVGQSIGARDFGAALKAQQYGMRWAIGWMLVGGALYFVLAPAVMEIYSDDPAVIEQGIQALRALSVGLPLWAVWFACGGALRGSGDTRTPMVTTAITIWSAVLLAYLGVRFFDGELGLVWGTFLVTAPIAAFGNWYLFRRRIARLHHQP